MDVSVMVEKVDGDGYRATAFVPANVVAEAPTRDEAVEQLRKLVGERLSKAELIRIEVPLAIEKNPWLAIAGTWRDNPDVANVMKNIEEYRRQIDADPDRI